MDTGELTLGNCDQGIISDTGASNFLKRGRVGGGKGKGYANPPIRKTFCSNPKAKFIFVIKNVLI